MLNLPAPRRRLASLLPVLFAALAVACGKDTGTEPPGPPNSLTIAAGNNQQVTVGAAAPVAPSVRVTDANGRGVPGISVRFDVMSGGGSVTGDSVVTGSDGSATVTEWRMGPTPGANQLRAQALGYSLFQTVTATAKPGAPSSLQIVSGGANLNAVVSQEVIPRPSVRVRDAFGNPVPDAIVTWSVTSGGGAIVGANQSTTDAEGRATIGGWKLGDDQGTNTLQARTANGLATTFTGMAIGTPSSVAAISPTTQTGYISFAVPKTARVRVLGADNGPVVGLPVIFRKVSGGGTITGDTTTTDINGDAALGDWRLGADGASTIEALVPGYPGGTVQFSATGTATPFTIDVRFLTETPADLRDAFITAALRWMTVITGDLPNQPLILAAGACQTGLSPALNETIDDMVIWASIIPIDGVGNILGQAGPCVERTGSELTAVGVMQFDIADALNLSQHSQFKDVVLHEMGHVLGFLSRRFQDKAIATGIGTNDPVYTGAQAVAAWPSLGIAYGGMPIPLENLYGQGTRDSHWRESVLGNELMTGIIASAGVTMPLSVISVAAMADLGYTVNMASADPWIPALLAAAPQAGATPINEDVREARFQVLPNGTVVPKP